jgi:hypothetical protein
LDERYVAFVYRKKCIGGYHQNRFRKRMINNSGRARQNGSRFRFRTPVRVKHLVGILPKKFEIAVEQEDPGSEC